MKRESTELLVWLVSFIVVSFAPREIYILLHVFALYYNYFNFIRLFFLMHVIFMLKQHLLNVKQGFNRS